MTISKFSIAVFCLFVIFAVGAMPAFCADPAGTESSGPTVEKLSPPASEKEMERNPFESSWDAETPTEVVQTPVAPTNLILEGIGMGPTGSYAVINGEVYREGEQKGGILVSKIRKKEVDIVTNGINMMLSTNRTEKNK